MLFSLSLLALGEYTQLAPIPTERRGAIGGIVGSQLLVAGGSGPVRTAGGALELYDIEKNVWTKGAKLLMSRSDAAAAPLGEGRLMVSGGMPSITSGNTSEAEIYDVATNTWTRAEPMQRARRGLALGPDVSRGLVYAVGGMDCMSSCYASPVEFLKTVEVYHLSTGKWEYLPDMHIGRRDLGVAVHEGKVYAIGGCGGIDKSYLTCEALDSWEVYDPDTGSWTLGQSTLPIARHGAATAVTDSAIILFGGSSGPGIDKTSSAKALVSAVDMLTLPASSMSPWNANVSTMPDARDGLVKGYGLSYKMATGKWVSLLVAGSDVTEAYVTTTEGVSLP